MQHTPDMIAHCDNANVIRLGALATDQTERDATDFFYFITDALEVGYGFANGQYQTQISRCRLAA